MLDQFTTERSFRTVCTPETLRATCSALRFSSWLLTSPVRCTWPFFVLTCTRIALTSRSAANADFTFVGNIIHFLRIDNLPQLINVLLGQMSLVGPRPEMPFIVEQYTPLQRQRLAVKPGMTGLWQISGRSDLTFDDLVRLDFYYLENWSIWLDVTILFKTPAAVFSQRGAY